MRIKKILFVLMLTIFLISSISTPSLNSTKERTKDTLATNSTNSKKSSQKLNSLTAVPSAPLSPKAVFGNGYINLSWLPPANNGSSPIKYYYIYYSWDSSTYNFGGLADANTTFYHELGSNGVIQYLEVSAWNSQGEGPRSVAVNATPATIPDAPFQLIAFDGINNISFQWMIPPDNGRPITEFKVYRSTTNNTGYSYLTSVNNTGQNPDLAKWTEYSVTANITYYYVMTSISIIGESAYSKQVNATALSPPVTTTQKSSKSSPGFDVLIVVPSIIPIILVKKRKIHLK